MRKPTMRNAEINKTTTLLYANRTGVEKDLGFGAKEYEYGVIQEMPLCLLNFTDAFAAKAYGVNVTGGLKATLTYEQAQEFNEHTRIWLFNQYATFGETLWNLQGKLKLYIDGVTPMEKSIDKQFPEYYVVKVPSAINQGLLVINKVDGNS